MRISTQPAPAPAPTSYVVELVREDGQEEIPWDCVRHFADPGYRRRVERAAARGRKAFGHRLKRLREDMNRQPVDLHQELQLTRQELVEELRETRSLLHEALKARTSYGRRGVRTAAWPGPSVRRLRDLRGGGRAEVRQRVAPAVPRSFRGTPHGRWHEIS